METSQKQAGIGNLVGKARVVTIWFTNLPLTGSILHLSDCNCSHVYASDEARGLQAISQKQPLGDEATCDTSW